MFCKTCGKEIDETSAFCPNCGCEINTAEPVSEDKDSTKETKKQNTFCLIGLILAIVSWFIALYGTVAIAGLVLSVLGIQQTKKEGQPTNPLGLTGVVLSVVSLIYTFFVLLFGIAFFAI